MKIRIDIQIHYGLVARAVHPTPHIPAPPGRSAALVGEFGWTNPLLVEAENGVIAGHAKLIAARQLGITKIPAIVVGISGLKSRD